jgi:hypothetical protein
MQRESEAAVDAVSPPLNNTAGEAAAAAEPAGLTDLPHALLVDTVQRCWRSIGVPAIWTLSCTCSTLRNICNKVLSISVTHLESPATTALRGAPPVGHLSPDRLMQRLFRSLTNVIKLDLTGLHFYVHDGGLAVSGGVA